MRKIIFTSLMLAMSVIAYSQAKYSEEFGKVTQNEMAMTSYESDKDAEAVVIYELGDYYFLGDDQRGFLLNMTKRIKVKILKQAGIKYATFEIPYYTGDNDWEFVEDIQGTTYNLENGQLIKTELNTKNIFEEKNSQKVHVKKITFSDVREGSVIELKYKISTPYYFNMRSWDFQKKIPVVHSLLRYKAIPYYGYTYILKGANKLDEFKSEVSNNEIRFHNLLYKEVLYNFGLKNIPAFRDEEFIANEEDHLVSLNFQMSTIFYPQGGSKEIMSTWPAMCDDFLKDDNLGKYIKNSEKEAKKILPTLDLAGKPQMEQVQIITEYVKSMYNWNGICTKFAYSKVSDFMKQKTGSSAEINLFLTGLLKAAQIEVYPVVLSTTDNGVVNKSHPFQQFFNYVIALVKVDNKLYNLDATEPLLYFTDLPPRCINVEGLLVKPKSEEWGILRQKASALTQKEFKIKIIPEKNMQEVEAKYTSNGYNAYSFRKIYMGKDENLSKYLKEKNNLEVKEDIEVTESDKLNKPFVFSFKFDSSIENSSDKLFIHPFCNLSIADNMFKQTSRTLPIDLVYVNGQIYKSTIEIPKGYKIEYLPKPYIMNDDLMSISYNLNQIDNRIEVMGSYNFSSSYYEAKNYIALKMAVAEMIKHFSEMVVLVKE